MRFMLFISSALVWIVAMAVQSSFAADNALILATTTSTENSGLLAHIHPDFEKKTGIRVKVVAKGTGASLQLARDGNADVVLVHAREQEDEFLREGFGVMRRDVMYNEFVLIGPSEDPARVAEAENPADALRRIAKRACPFISRGDQSGTHMREQQLWRQSGVSLRTDVATIFADGRRRRVETVFPEGIWYYRVGQGMGKTIMIASEKDAYTLADRGTYYAFALTDPPRTNLVILCDGHPSLRNPYSVIAVNPNRHPHVNISAAKRYIQWITSPDVQQLIGNYRIRGRILFHPAATGTH